MEEEGGHDERPSFLLPAASLHERTPSPRAARRPPSRASASASSQSQSQPKQSKAKAKPKPKPTLKRRLTLDDELRSAVPFLHEDGDDEEGADVPNAHVDPGDAYMAEVAQQDADEVQDAPQQEEEDMDSGVLVGVGTRSKRRGFLAHGGAGGAPVFMGVGYVEGAEEDEAQEAGEYENRGGSEYADEAQDEDYEDGGDGGDDDDDEYLPSPDPRARQGRGQRRRWSVCMGYIYLDLLIFYPVSLFWFSFSSFVFSVFFSLSFLFLSFSICVFFFEIFSPMTSSVHLAVLISWYYIVVNFS
jgi:hypothetical protein